MVKNGILHWPKAVLDLQQVLMQDNEGQQHM